MPKDAAKGTEGAGGEGIVEVSIEDMINEELVRQERQGAYVPSKESQDILAWACGINKYPNGKGATHVPKVVHFPRNPVDQDDEDRARRLAERKKGIERLGSM